MRGNLEQRIIRVELERDARLTFPEARAKLLDALEGVRQAVVTQTGIAGDLFGDLNGAIADADLAERRMTQGVQVIALADFNDALDKAFPDA
ncbi:MAG TPA: hypothetical protein VGN13_12240 [Solirubrobacteraceae bacterium]